jgi:hypothetical protein
MSLISTRELERLEKVAITEYDKTQESWLFSAIAIGILVGTYPCTVLLAKYGTR